MLKTENVSLVVTDEAIRSMADAAFIANSNIQNIGARRLYTVVEKVAFFALCHATPLQMVFYMFVGSEIGYI